MTVATNHTTNQQPVTPVNAALAAFGAGRPVLILHAELGAEVALAAHDVTAHWIAWTVRYSAGLLHAALTHERADALHLPPMIPAYEGTCALTVSVDARHGITTGISARDRARTMRLLADPSCTPDDLVRPGHVLPICVEPQGVRNHERVIRAAVELCRLAGLPPVAATATLLRDNGTLPAHAEVREFAAHSGIPVLTPGEVVGAVSRRRDSPRGTRGKDAL